MIFLVSVSFLSKGANWTGVELDEFMDCPYNLAHNRQTRMLADLTLAGCYTGYNSTEDQLERDRILLQSAKQNLAKMAYFGLTEQQSASQYIFEQTFQLDFANSFDQANATLSAQAIAELTPSQVIQSSFPTFWSSFLVTNHVVNMNPPAVGANSPAQQFRHAAIRFRSATVAATIRGAQTTGPLLQTTLAAYPASF